VAANCPPLKHPEVLTVAAATNPCAARKGESAALMALRVVRTYQRTTALAGNLPTRFPLRCGDAGYGYLHLLDALSKGRTDHGDPVNDTTFDAEIAAAWSAARWAARTAQSVAEPEVSGSGRPVC
jgi:hypothetical protein